MLSSLKHIYEPKNIGFYKSKLLVYRTSPMIEEQIWFSCRTNRMEASGVSPLVTIFPNDTLYQAHRPAPGNDLLARKFSATNN